MQSGSIQPEQGKAGITAPPVATRNGSRIERTVWVALLVLPLLTYCVVAVLAFSIKPTPIITGDALYDKYLTWLADDLAKNPQPGIFDNYWGIWGTYDSDETWDPFAEWEAEFGNDPRYWMLRYRYSLARIDSTSKYVENNIWHLEKARELGVADGAALLTLLTEMEDSLEFEYTFQHPGNPKSLEYLVARGKHYRRQVDSLIGEKHTLLLAELLDVAGDESLPHYYAAMYDEQRGDYKSAIVHLKNGNQSKTNSILLGFPYSDLLSEKPGGKSSPYKVLCGLIYYDQSANYDLGSMRLLNYIHFKWMLKTLVADAIANGDLAALDEIHTFSCRIGVMAGSDPYALLVGIGYAGIIQKELENSSGFSPTQQQQADLAKLKVLRSQIKGQAKNLSGGFNPMPVGLEYFELGFLFLEYMITSEKSFSLITYKNAYDQFNNEQTALAQIKPLFEQMESFNYNTLEFE